MDDRLKSALEFSNFKQSFAVKFKQIKEKIDAKLTYGYNGGIFKIDKSLLTFVDALNQTGRTSSVILDHNENPIMIEDLSSFKDEIFDRYFSATNEYYNEFQQLKKSRSVERLLDV
jgi:hypothetical protein